MEFVSDFISFKFLPNEIIDLIETEIMKIVQPVYEVDPLTGELNEEFERDYKVAQYIFLDWLKNTYPANKVLYAGSGSDFLPKTVFGTEKVFHTSMEEYKYDDDKYFPDLGEGIKVVADNNLLPFPDSSFDAVLFFGLSTESTKTQMIEAGRVLAEGGLIACDSNVSENIDFKQIFPNYEIIDVPCEFQCRGITDTCFFVIRK